MSGVFYVIESCRNLFAIAGVLFILFQCILRVQISQHSNMRQFNDSSPTK